jgi:hypothetical protein
MIESAQYIQNDEGKNCNIKAVIDGDTWFVPLNTDNRHYAAILEWAEEDGNTIQEAD